MAARANAFGDLSEFQPQPLSQRRSERKTPSEDIDRLATEDAPNVACTAGWRADVFGADAMALKSGKLALGVDGKRVKLIR